MASQRPAARIAKDFSLARSSVTDPRDTPFEACGTQQVGGSLEQRSTVDQFHQCFRPLTTQYETPSAMCGYFSVANALILSRELPAHQHISREELRDVIAKLEDPSVVTAEAERVMAFIQDCRKCYIDSHSSDFKSTCEVARYKSDWVANYEISDYLVAEAGRGSLLDSVHFFRYNQMPEIGTATHEERVRLEDERCFGSAVPGGADSKVLAELEPGATRFFVERFLPGHALLRPEQWATERDQDSPPPVFVVDVNDHFVVAVPLVIEPSSDTTGGPTLFVVNTTSANYLHSPALVYLFDLVFGETKARD